jgi:protein-tyrosine phosphatase
MTSRSYPRHIEIEFAGNLRDLGGYRTREGRTVAWRRLFRSGELRHNTEGDIARLRQETGLSSVLDLRGDMEIREERVKLLSEGGIRYHNVPLITGGRDPGSDDGDELFTRFTNMGEFYLFLMGHEDFSEKLAKALEIIADSENHPILFHCTVGKDRTGILAAAVLSILGVGDGDIVNDYNLTTPHMARFIERMKGIPEAEDMLEKLPAYIWEASRESMEMVLSGIRRNYGSVRGYLETHGTDSGLFDRLERALLDGNS